MAGGVDDTRVATVLGGANVDKVVADVVVGCVASVATVLGGANVDKVVADVVVGCVASVMGSSCKCDVWCSRRCRCRRPVV